MSEKLLPPQVFMWFWSNPETEVTFKIYCVAPDLATARAHLDKMPMSNEARFYYRNITPQIFTGIPWAEVNIQQSGGKPYCVAL